MQISIIGKIFLAAFAASVLGFGRLAKIMAALLFILGFLAVALYLTALAVLAVWS